MLHTINCQFTNNAYVYEEELVSYKLQPVYILGYACTHNQ